MFKSAQIYRVESTFDDPPVFREIGEYEERTGGFFQVTEGNLVVEVNGCKFLKYRVDSKILPPGAIKKIVDERCQGKRCDREEVKRQVILEKLPTALVKTTEVLMYFDGDMLVVDGTPKQAEEIIETLGIRAAPLQTLVDPSVVMTRTLDEHREETFQHQGFSLGDRCECIGTDEKVTFRGVDLPCEEVQRCIEDMVLTVDSMTLVYQGIEFTLCSDLGLKRIRWPEELKDQAAEIELTVFAANMFVMTGELRKLIRALCEALGGVDDL